jgi:hypothetical protein
MEAFEAFVPLTMEDDDFVVSEAVKFPVEINVRGGYHQRHGFEVDLVGARADKVVLATVKSFFGSRGVVADDVAGVGSHSGRYAILNKPIVRASVVRQACDRFGYEEDQVELRLYVGRFAGEKSGEHERSIRAWCAKQFVGGGPIRVFGLQDVAARARRVASGTTYRDNPALVAIKVLDAAGMLTTLQSGQLWPGQTATAEPTVCPGI